MWKWIAIILGLLCVVFLALGFLKPDVHVVSTAQIARSPDAVWQVFTDASRTRGWMTGLESMETLSGGHLQPGSVHKLVFLEGNRRIEMQEKVTAVEPSKLYAFDSSMDMMTGSTEVRLAAKGGGTELTIDSTYRGSSLVWRSLLALMQGQMQDREAADLAKLKALIESEPAG